MVLNTFWDTYMMPIAFYLIAQVRGFGVFRCGAILRQVDG